MKKFKLLVATLALSAFGLSACQQQPSIPSTDSNAKNVISVALDEESLEKEIGDTFTLTPLITYKDDKEVEVTKLWKSSNTKVAIVDQEGNVIVKGSGKANIAFIAGSKIAVCELTVKGSDEPTPTPTPTPTPDPEDPTQPSLTLSTGSKTLKPGESFVLTATAQNVSGGLAWANQDNTVATIQEQGDSVKITAVAEGQTVVSASIGDLVKNCTVKVIAEQGGGEEEEDEDKSCAVYFFIDFNNADEKDETGTKLLKTFKWYTDRPLKDSGLVPNSPTTALDPAFPYFIGWSSHPIIDNKSDLWDLDKDVTGNRNFIYIYGIWADTQI